MISIACNSTEIMFVLLTLGFVVSHHIYQRYRTFRLMLFYMVNFGCIKLDLPLEANESEIKSNDNQFPVLIRENLSIFCGETLFDISINFKIKYYLHCYVFAWPTTFCGVIFMIVSL